MFAGGNDYRTLNYVKEIVGEPLSFSKHLFPPCIPMFIISVTFYKETDVHGVQSESMQVQVKKREAETDPCASKGHTFSNILKFLSNQRRDFPAESSYITNKCDWEQKKHGTLVNCYLNFFPLGISKKRQWCGQIL